MQPSNGRSRQRVASVVLICVAGLAAFTDSGARELSCPRVLATIVQTATGIPLGWKAEQAGLKHILIGVRINFGDPSAGDDGAIYDQRTVKSGGGGAQIETLTWDLTGLHDPYLVCAYFGTSVVLTRSLAGLSRCQVVSVLGGSRIRSATCR